MKYIKINCIVGLCLWITQNCTSQNNVIPHFFDEIEALSSRYPDSAWVKVLHYSAKAHLQKSQQTIGEAYCIKGMVQSDQSMYYEAILTLDSALQINKKYNNKALLATNHAELASCYQNIGDFGGAIKHFNTSLAFAIPINDVKIIHFCYRSLSKISCIQQNYNKGIEYLEIIENKFPIQNNKKEEGLLLHAYGDYYIHTGKTTKAFEYYTQAIEVFKEANIPYSQAWTQAQMAITFAATDLNKTLALMLNSQSIYDTIAPKSIFSINNLQNIGEVIRMFATDDSLLKTLNIPGFIKDKQWLYDESEKYFKKSLAFAKAQHAKNDVMTISGNLANLYSNKGDYKSAFEYYNVYHNLSDSIFSQKNKNTIAKLESEKTLQSLESANKHKSWLNYFLLSLSILLLSLGYLLYKNFKHKQELQQHLIKELQKEKQLNAIDALLQGQMEERSRIAKDLHDGLGGMLNGIKYSINHMKDSLVMTEEDGISFAKSLDQLDNTITELRRIAHNLMPESLVKYGLHNAIIDYCTLQKKDDAEVLFQHMGDEKILSNIQNLHIYRIVQELINNAINHGQSKRVIVQITYATDKLLIDVDDDGKGFDTSAQSQGMGMISLKQRVSYFNGQMKVTSAPSNGTSVNIELTI